MSRDTEPCCALWTPYVRHEHEHGCPSRAAKSDDQPAPPADRSWVSTEFITDRPSQNGSTAHPWQRGQILTGADLDRPVPYVLSHPAVGALEELLAALDAPGKPDTTEDQLFRILRAVDHARDVVSEARLAE